MMSCFFCSSETRLSLNCTKFTSNESRKEIAYLKNYCDSCLTSLNTRGPHYNNGKCSNFRKCYICFSRNHHTVFCPNRFGVPTIFFPEIDSIFFQRFFEMFNPAEKFLLIYSLTEPRKLCALKNVEVLHKDLWYSNFAFNDVEKHDPAIVVARKLNISKHGSDPEKFEKFIIALSTQVLIFKAENITLMNVEMADQAFMQLLSSCTKALICNKILLSSDVDFATVLKKAPNIETIEIFQSNIIISDKWPQDLLQYTHGKKYKKLNITSNNLNINYDHLATFMTTKSTKDVQIILNVDFAFNRSEMCEKLSDHFISCKKYGSKIPFLSICYFEDLKHFETFMIKKT